jgi:hypothetical protein
VVLTTQLVCGAVVGGEVAEPAEQNEPVAYMFTEPA